MNDTTRNTPMEQPTREEYIASLRARIANAKTCTPDDAFTIGRDDAIALWEAAIKWAECASSETKHGDAEDAARYRKLRDEMIRGDRQPGYLPHNLHRVSTQMDFDAAVDEGWK